MFTMNIRNKDTSEVFALCKGLDGRDLKGLKELIVKVIRLAADNFEKEKITGSQVFHNMEGKSASEFSLGFDPENYSLKALPTVLVSQIVEGMNSVGITAKNIEESIEILEYRSTIKDIKEMLSIIDKLPEPSKLNF